MTPQQQAKLERLANHADNPTLAIAEDFNLLNDKIDALKEDNSTELKSGVEAIKTMIQSIEIPEPKDHTGHMEQMMKMIEEPMDITVTLNIK